MALLCAREAVMQYFRPLHRAHGITEQQWRVLRMLNKCGDLEISELARQAVLKPPSLSRILRDLEAAGMVSRRAVARDQRRGLISITPYGTGPSGEDRAAGAGQPLPDPPPVWVGAPGAAV
jgi:homoprotocatechuate degradation regulator HpaR